MKNPAPICDTIVMAWIPSGYVLMAVWEKRALLCLSQRRNMPWKAKASVMAQMTEKAVRIYLEQSQFRTLA